MKAGWLIGAFALAVAVLPATASAKGTEENVDIVAGGDMSGWGYSPSSITISAGTTVTWHNTGSQAHSVTSRDHLFDSRLMDEDDEWSYTFNTPGTYRYFCVPFPFMKGTIVVTAVSEGSSSSKATPTPSPTATPTTSAGASSGNSGSSSADLVGP